VFPFVWVVRKELTIGNSDHGTNGNRKFVDRTARPLNAHFQVRETGWHTYPRVKLGEAAAEGRCLQYNNPRLARRGPGPHTAPALTPARPCRENAMREPG